MTVAKELGLGQGTGSRLYSKSTCFDVVSIHETQSIFTWSSEPSIRLGCRGVTFFMGLLYFVFNQAPFKKLFAFVKQSCDEPNVCTSLSFNPDY